MNEKIINLTQHYATVEQLSVGVVEVEDKKALCNFLTFIDAPSSIELQKIAFDIAQFAKGYQCAMIGGAPYLMSALEIELKQLNVQPIYSFSKRQSVEKVELDGTVTKINVFKHVGWIYI